MSSKAWSSKWFRGMPKGGTDTGFPHVVSHGQDRSRHPLRRAAPTSRRWYARRWKATPHYPARHHEARWSRRTNPRKRSRDTYVGYSGQPDLGAENSYVRIDGPRIWMELVVQRAVPIAPNCTTTRCGATSSPTTAARSANEARGARPRAAGLCAAPRSRTAHRSRSCKLDFLARAVRAEILVPESELAFATAADPANLSRRICCVTSRSRPRGAPWKIEVLVGTRHHVSRPCLFAAEVVLTPPAGHSDAHFVLVDDAVTHEVRNHVIVVLAQTSAAPVMLGALQHPVRTLQIDQIGAQVWTPPAITSAEYESSPTFSPDGREMFSFGANTRFDDYRLLVSRCEEAHGPRREPPSFASKLPVLEADPFFPSDGDTSISSRRAPRGRPGKRTSTSSSSNRGAGGGWARRGGCPSP